MATNYNGRRRQLRLVYMAGPGDVIGTYHHWRNGHPDPSQIAATYSGQFFDLCRELGAEAYIISYHHRREIVHDNGFTIEHRPMLWRDRRGLLYHLGVWWFVLSVGLTAVRFRASAAIVMLGTNLFPLAVARLLGVHIIPSVHCALWPVAGKQGGIHEIVRRLDRPLLGRACAGILSISETISEQICETTRGRHAQIQSFIPTYRRDGLMEFAPLPPSPPFRVLFAGRLESNKGVYHLWEAANFLRDAGCTDIEFDLCGDGSQFFRLQKLVRERGAEAWFRLHGHQTRPAMANFLRRCHVVIAPTRSDMIEGFNKVAVEGPITGRPVITSRVCPSLASVREAAIEVQPDDVRGYAEAIRQLRDDRDLLQSLATAGHDLRERFFDQDQSFSAALRRILRDTVPFMVPELSRQVQTSQTADHAYQRTAMPWTTPGEAGPATSRGGDARQD